MGAVMAGLCLALVCLAAPAAQLPIFDAHIHYSLDTWDALPPKAAIALLREARVMRALVSSSNDDGTDTYAAERWPFVVEHARLARQWLAELPRDVAEKIAFRNGEGLFGGTLGKTK